MGSNGFAAKRYIRSVSNTLACSGKAKKRILSQIRDSVDDYLIQNPDADFEMIEMHFGTPQEIAASYVNEQDASMLLKKMGIKKKILVVVASVMAAFVLIWIGVATWGVYRAEASSDRYITQTVGQE